MANKRKNIPIDLLKEILEKNWGSIVQTRLDLAKAGYHCARQTIVNYIQEYYLEDWVESLRDDITEICCYKMIEEAKDSPDAERQRQCMLNMRGHNIGWRPNEVAHQQKLEQIQAQSKEDRDLEKEKRRNEMMKMTQKQDD